jgi:hypothetical protein
MILAKKDEEKHKSLRGEGLWQVSRDFSVCTLDLETRGVS